MKKLSQENIVLILVALALAAVIWFEFRTPARSAVPTPAAPVPEPDVPITAYPWYFGNTVFANVPPLPSVMPRLTVGNGAGGAGATGTAGSPSWAYGDCRSCSGIPPGIRN